MGPREDAVLASIRRHLAAGGLVCGLTVTGLGGWAAATTLAGAVVASGQLVVESHIKKVQHPTGGVVGEIRVREGARVGAGDVLIRLDATQARATLAIARKRLDELAARQARLEAERDDADAIAFPAALAVRAHDPEVAALTAGERSLFGLRRAARHGQKAQLAERIAQAETEIRGLAAQEEAKARGMALIERELAGLRGLFDRGLVSIQRMMALEREAAALDGERGRLAAARAQVAGRIAETRLQILQIDQDLRSEVATSLREVEAQTAEYVERRVAAQDQVDRVDIVAPQAGRVHELAVHTVGGVIAAAETIMLVVPEDDALALEVQVAPQDIDQIRLGQPAVLRLSAFNQRTTPELAGEVSRIAAELSREERTGRSWYLVRIAVPAAEIARLGGLRLVAGMPAEAFVRTGERSALSYLVKPLRDQLARAFREE
ncbi:HlyD family type I secretion periplasmic adaptor subunit [Rhodoplanes sp. TEM]|uniref:Membrane fusion protein (MFP) family protein n=1 Tax=Rhodoplanes tepidamans TaxID=200616 RepID=A0ABT5JF34_RHOTP|nr:MULTISPECIES: HlyD family type I secretion periplasmic adaptor subunit [Rhodoplanes]MDC7788028.1 HlyD family type I secretion periplasmic adaptor subunit [Rhodoplanes tepidamans]MDC7988151.1 HlyD family type I secretion periplasmic adaptor subunit [Rhodoplanes sp. TEM]MDQ0353983.1 HlyD family secretion protein [Rhodoplanes tepidamans]